MIDGMLNEQTTIMGFEAFDNALILWLNMCGEVWFEKYDFDILKAIWNGMGREVVLKEKDFMLLLLKLQIPMSQPWLMKSTGHPCLHIVVIIKAQPKTCFLFKNLGLCCFSDYEGRMFFRAIHIGCECIGQSNLLSLQTRELFVGKSLIRW